MHKNRKSYRLQDWDYRNEGFYFITICTKDKTHYFGEIEKGKMILSPCGAIANVLWAELPHRYDSMDLGEFIIMPNHIHGIIQLHDIDMDDGKDVPTIHQSKDVACSSCTDVARNVPTVNEQKNHQMSDISPKSNSISTIMRSYKSSVTKHCNRLDLDFAWHTRFHDHIIRNEKSFHKISEYIIYNPEKWEEDMFYS